MRLEQILGARNLFCQSEIIISKETFSALGKKFHMNKLQFKRGCTQGLHIFPMRKLSVVTTQTSTLTKLFKGEF